MMYQLQLLLVPIAIELELAIEARSRERTRAPAPAGMVGKLVELEYKPRRPALCLRALNLSLLRTPKEKSPRAKCRIAVSNERSRLSF